jgi:hypothetical protein
MFENLVAVIMNDILPVLIYATYQPIDQVILPLITNVLIHLRRLIDPIEIHLE